MDRLKQIRDSEKQYHDQCYSQYELFEPGSWLHKPVKTVLELLPLIERKSHPFVLDLGAGAGRNSIPIAERLAHCNGKVVCVDLLDSALEKLIGYSKVYGVEKVIEPVKANLDNYFIRPDTYDLIVAISSLEHTSSETKFDHLLDSAIMGTKAGGIHCLVVNTDMVEIDIESNVEMEAMMELNFSTEFLLAKFRHIYDEWHVIKEEVKHLEYNIVRDNKAILLKTKAITYVVQKQEKGVE
jgi:SAM-dependent methyltransferase